MDVQWDCISLRNKITSASLSAIIAAGSMCIPFTVPTALVSQLNAPQPAAASQQALLLQGRASRNLANTKGYSCW